MRSYSLTLNLFLAFVIFLGGQLLGAGQKANPSQQSHPETLRLYLRAGAIDPLAQVASSVPVTGDGPGLHVVQFTGPIQDAWLTSLQSCGLSVVSYIPDYAYLVWGEASRVDCLGQRSPLHWQGPYRAVYALHPSLTVAAVGDKPDATAPQDVIIQLFETPETAAAVRTILNQAQEVLRQPHSLLGYRVLAVRLPFDRLMQVAALPGVVNIEPLPRYTRNDEVQGQIMAGNLSPDGALPSGPGYLAWLSAQGFSTNPDDYPIVDVTDDGIDDGSVVPVHADFYQFGDQTNADRLIYNTNWTSDLAADGLNGHGNLNASIVVGYNDLSGSAYTDNQGYHYGLGINPFGRVSGSKVFSSVYGWDLPNSDFRALITGTYLSGGRISTNSWGSYTFGSYTFDDQMYDSLVRDAVQSQLGNQEITILFSAGNNGPYSGSTGSPGNAKNVLTVGAAENYRPTWTDGCYIPPQGADNANDIIDFSSRGPTADGRNKPDLVAPGTHIQGAASQIAGYNGYNVCDAYQPTGQTLYAASSGTSHSTPAVAGAASLLFAYYQQHFSADPPSPAMVKAYLTNATRYLDGLWANDTLPSPSQGFGEIHLGQAFNSAARILVDQQVEFSESGQVYEIDGRINDPNKPLRITLAWTDAPGVPYAAAYVNDLDLEVELNGQTYRGNVFVGAFSTPGGQSDSVNNLESVFLPVGFSGEFQVRVHASNIAGDGVPGDSDQTDQDFALVVYNGAQIVGYLNGAVTDSATGNSLPGALIQASSGSWSQDATTDATGAYTLPLQPGAYDVLAWKYGFAPAVATDVVIVEDQVSEQNFALSLAENYSLQGCVSDQATGQGLAATITAIGPLSQWMTQTLTTRLNPCYHLELYAAPYTVRAESLLHFPGEAQVNLGANTLQDFALEATTLSGLLTGQVLDYNTDEPLGAIELHLEPPVTAYPGPYQTTTASNGDYQILLPPDTYTVSIDQSFYQPFSVGGVVVPQSNIEQRDFALRSARMEIAPYEPLRFDLQPGEQASATLSLRNVGSAPLDYLIYETDDSPLAGGPDPAGYVVWDSRSSDAVRYEWLDVSDGTRLDLWDDSAIDVDLPFPFTYYGKQSSALRISNNGAALFGDSSDYVYYFNQPLSIAPDDLIAPFWDDLDADYGWVGYKTVGEAPQRLFVVEWFNRPHFQDATSGVSFELILYEGSNNLKFQYQDVFFGGGYVDQGSSATVGIRGQGAAYLEYLFEAPLLTNEMSLCFQAPGALPCDVLDYAWLDVSPISGSLDPQNEVTLTVQVDAVQVGLGVQTAALRLWGNDRLRQPYVDIPVRLIVHGNEWYFPFVMHFPQFFTSLLR